MMWLFVIAFTFHGIAWSQPQGNGTNNETQSQYKHWYHFDTGVVRMDYYNDIINLTAGDCTLSLYWSQIEDLDGQISKSNLSEEDIFHIILRDKGYGDFTGFAAIKKEKRSKYKFLPFRLEDLGSIMNLAALPIWEKTNAYTSETVEIPFPECGKQLTNTTTVDGLENTAINIFVIILLFTVTYNAYWDKRIHDVCLLNFNQYEDTPFSIITCCDFKEEQIFKTSQRVSSSVSCSGPDRSREYLAGFATTLGFVCFLFVPLLVKYLPATPEKWRKMKDKCLRKCFSRKRDDQTKEAKGVTENSCDDANRHKRSAASIKLQRLLPPSLATSPKEEFEVYRRNQTRSPDAVRQIEVEYGETSKEDDVRITDDDYEKGAERIYLDTDSEYYMSTWLFASFVCLTPSYIHIAALIRRLVCLILLWMVTGSLFFITHLYYNNVLDSCFFAPQRSFMHTVSQAIYPFATEKLKAGDDNVAEFDYEDNDSKFKEKVWHLMSFSGPVIIACFNMMLLYFILVRPDNVCQALSWYEDKKSELKFVKGREVPPTTHLYYNMQYRLSRLTSNKFWKLWWDRCVCRWSPMYQFQKEVSSPTFHRVFQTVLVFIRLPFSVVYLFLYTLPVFTILRNVFSKPGKLLLCGLDKNKRGSFPGFIFVTFPLTLLGIALLYVMLFDLIMLLCHVATFFLVDTLRNSETTLPSVVFLTSVLLYIRGAFGDFEDGYRKLKGSVFELSEAIALEAESKGLRSVLAENETVVLFRRDEIGQSSIPKQVFKRVCKKYRPYRLNMLKTILKLLCTLVVIGFLFAITIEFQIFEQFSAGGETLLMVFTVSIPRLFGKMKSEDQWTLSRAELNHRITATITSLVKEKPVSEQGIEADLNDNV